MIQFGHRKSQYSTQTRLHKNPDTPGGTLTPLNPPIAKNSIINIGLHLPTPSDGCCQRAHMTPTLHVLSKSLRAVDRLGAAHAGATRTMPADSAATRYCEGRRMRHADQTETCS